MEIKTNTLILTFNIPKIPDSLKLCCLNIPVGLGVGSCLASERPRDRIPREPDYTS